MQQGGQITQYMKHGKWHKSFFFFYLLERETATERETVVNSLQNLPLYRDLHLELKHQCTMSLTSGTIYAALLSHLLISYSLYKRLILKGVFHSFFF